MVEYLDVEEVMDLLMAISDMAESLEDCDPYIAREIKRIADLLLFKLVGGGAIMGGRASAGLEDPASLDPPSTTTSEREVNMMEIDLWDETEGKSRPIARLKLNEDNELEIIAGRGKVRIDKVSIGSEFESAFKDRYQVSLTNLSMPIDLDSDSVIEVIK